MKAIEKSPDQMRPPSSSRPIAQQIPAEWLGGVCRLQRELSLTAFDPVEPSEESRAWGERKKRPEPAATRPGFMAMQRTPERGMPLLDSARCCTSGDHLATHGTGTTVIAEDGGVRVDLREHAHSSGVGDLRVVTSNSVPILTWVVRRRRFAGG